MSRRSFAALLVAMTLGGAAVAQDAPPADTATLPAASDLQAPVAGDARRQRSVIAYGSDPCPVAEPGEVVVCSRQPESERYRVPRQFRDEVVPAQNQSWARRAEAVDATGRAAGGLPDTCSPVGSGGQTGCALQAAQRAAAERAAARQPETAVP